MHQQLLHFLNRFIPAPEEWFANLEEHEKKPLLSSIPCTSYYDLLDSWKAAGIKITDAIDIAFSTMLGTVAGCKIRDDQVFLRVIGIAGTLKTTLCEALCVNRDYTFPLSAQRGFHSGYTGGGGDNSLIPLMKDKTVIINEGDMLLKSPNCAQTLSEIRDIWSGVTRAFFRNGVAYEHEGLKTNFIIAGTPTLRELNESAAGDRFLDVVIYEKESTTAERQLVRDIAGSGLSNFFAESNGQISSHDSAEKTIAKQKTGGFVGYLRQTVGEKLDKLKDSIPSTFISDCESLGLLVAKMRTRPMAKGENKTEAELHVRLTKQLIKSAITLAVVLNRPLDSEIMRRIAHVAEDTCYGNTFFVCRALANKAMDISGLAVKLRITQDTARKAVNTLISLESIVADQSLPVPSGAKRRGTYYRLSPQQVALMSKLHTLLGHNNATSN